MPDYPIDKNVKKNPSKDLKLSDNLDQTPKYVQSKEGSNHVNTPLALSTEKVLIKGDLDVVGQITTNGTAVSTGSGSDTNTTYTISTTDGLAGSKKIIRLTGSDSSTDDVTLVAGTGITLSQSSDEITITNSVTDTDTVLSTEQVQDIVGAMLSSNTETDITATYQDADGTIDFVVSDSFLRNDADDTTTGRITAGALTVDTNTLYVDSSNNRVGIGTDSPATHLDVFHTSAPEITIRGDADNSGALCFGDTYYKAGRIVYGHTNNEMELMTASATKLKLSANQVDVYKDLNLASGEVYKIDDTTVLTNDTLSSGVVNSSLTSVGTITSGTWNGTTIASAYLDSDTAHLSGTQTFSGAKTFGADTTFDGHIILNADNKIKSDTTSTHNFIEFDDDSGSPENQTLVSSVTNVALIVDGNNNGTGQFEVLKGGTDATTTELFRIENDGDARLEGDLNLTSGHTYKVASNDVLNQTTLGSTVVNSSLTNVGTLGSLTVSGDATFDTSTLKVDSSNNRVGIGITSPTTTLDVEGTISYKHISLTADSDDLDVSDCTVVECTPSGTDRLGGLTGGVQGQILYILKVDSGFGRIIIEHNEGTGNQDIFLSGASDLMLSSRKGITLYCTGSIWIQIG